MILAFRFNRRSAFFSHVLFVDPDVGGYAGSTTSPLPGKLFGISAKSRTLFWFGRHGHGFTKLPLFIAPCAFHDSFAAAKLVLLQQMLEQNSHDGLCDRASMYFPAGSKFSVLIMGGGIEEPRKQTVSPDGAGFRFWMGLRPPELTNPSAKFNPGSNPRFPFCVGAALVSAAGQRIGVARMLPGNRG